MTVSPGSVHVWVICARRSWLPGFGGDACQRHHARADGWPGRHRRGLPVIGRRSWQYRTLGPAAGRWAAVVWKGRWDPWRTRGCGPAARTPRNLDPREAGWGPTCDRLFSVTRPHARRTPSTDGAFPRAAVRARQRAGGTGAHAPIRPGPYLVLLVNGRRRSHRSRPDLHVMHVIFRVISDTLDG